MYEVEMKAELGDVDAALAQLRAIGCEFSPPVEQLDTIFAVNANAILTPHPGTIVLRLRNENGHQSFTFKQHRTDELDCLEYNVRVRDAEDMAAVLVALGFPQILLVRKIRQSCKAGPYSVNVDVVDELGAFIELEEIVDMEDADTVRARMMTFLQAQSISTGKIVKKGYDRLLLEARQDPMLPPDPSTANYAV